MRTLQPRNDMKRQKPVSAYRQEQRGRLVRAYTEPKLRGDLRQRAQRCVEIAELGGLIRRSLDRSQPRPLREAA